MVILQLLLRNRLVEVSGSRVNRQSPMAQKRELFCCSLHLCSYSDDPDRPAEGAPTGRNDVSAV